MIRPRRRFRGWRSGAGVSFISLATGCSGAGSSWLDSTPASSQGQPATGTQSPLALVGALAIAGVVEVGSAVVNAFSEVFHNANQWGGPGVAYDSQEGRALRIPGYPLE